MFQLITCQSVFFSQCHCSRAKAEAAPAKVSFVQREADMIKAQAYIEEQQQKAAAEATRKKAELEASQHTLRLESAAAAAQAETNVLEAAAENEFGELSARESARLKNEYVEHKYTKNTRPEPHQDSKLLEPKPTPVCQLTMDIGEIAENSMGEDNDESSEISNYELSYHNLPVQQTFKHEDDATPCHPHAQTSSRTCPLKPERLHSSNTHQYSNRTQSHNTRQIGSSYQPTQSHNGATPRTNDPNPSATTDQYLIRREMISSGLLRFDDRPENY